MQLNNNSASEIKEKLLGALDKDYNVVDMATVFEVVSTLEKIHITKEALEKTRLGRHINELRRKTNNEQLARRIKDLVKSWRKLIPQTESSNINGDKIAGGITPPGPGPGPRLNSNSVVTNRLSGLNVNSRFKPASPTVSYDRLTSPLSLSASNSPLLQPSSKTIVGGSRPVTPNTYAPIRSNAAAPTNLRQHAAAPFSDERVSSPAPTSGPNAMSNVFTPVSPVLQAIKQSMNSNKCSGLNSNLSPVLNPKPNSPAVVTSSKSSFNNNNNNNNSCSSGKKSLHKSGSGGGGGGTNSNDSFPSGLSTIPASSAAIDDSVHSKLSIAKTNPANKRLRKNDEDETDSVNGVSHPHKKQKLLTSESVSVNGLDSGHYDSSLTAAAADNKVKASQWSAFESVKSSSQDASGTGVGVVLDNSNVTEVCLTDVSGNINNTQEVNSNVLPPPPPTTTTVTGKKRGRKKKEKRPDPTDILREKIGLATAHGSGFQKVKTTQQLIEDLQAKNVVAPGSLKVNTPPAPPPVQENHHKQPTIGKNRHPPFPSSDAETTKAKSELMDRFLNSTSANRAGPSNSPEIRNKFEYGDGGGDSQKTYYKKTPSKVNEEIEKILSSLPKLDPSVLEEIDAAIKDEVTEEDMVEDEMTLTSEKEIVVTDDDIKRVIQDEWEYVNGIRDQTGQWREWQDTALRASQNGDLLHILPYVNIDW